MHGGSQSPSTRLHCRASPLVTNYSGPSSGDAARKTPSQRSKHPANPSASLQIELHCPCLSLLHVKLQALYRLLGSPINASSKNLTGADVKAAAAAALQEGSSGKAYQVCSKLKSVIAMQVQCSSLLTLSCALQATGNLGKTHITASSQHSGFREGHEKVSAAHTCQLAS